MKKPSAGTKPRQFRIGDDILDLMDRLMVKHALKSRTAVIQTAVKQMADRDLIEPIEPIPVPRKKISKSAKKTKKTD